MFQHAHCEPTLTRDSVRRATDSLTRIAQASSAPVVLSHADSVRIAGNVNWQMRAARLPDSVRAMGQQITDVSGLAGALSSHLLLNVRIEERPPRRGTTMTMPDGRVIHLPAMPFDAGGRGRGEPPPKKPPV